MEKLTQIAGVDGCKGGRWIAVTASVEGFGTAEVKTFESTAELISKLAPRTLIAIDVPIGLPERAIGGGREADWLARAFLGPRRTSIFPVTSRRAVYGHGQGYSQVCAISRETSDPPRAPSIFLFGILPRIQDVDIIMRQNPVLRRRVFEVHPEVSFQVMNNNSPLSEPKKVKGRPLKSGMEFRKKLLTKAGFSLSFLQNLPTDAGEDDFYDACACAWSAKRILLGKARVFPSIPPLDGDGLEQAIRA